MLWKITLPENGVRFGEMVTKEEAYVHLVGHFSSSGRSRGTTIEVGVAPVNQTPLPPTEPSSNRRVPLPFPQQNHRQT
ncbi:hypothetical protein TNCT_569361 [Trichonephila clavata]|uniref:Uncharacterized protein n=1 Tax=Trichonephila clavata TaxID=2740835 RepID=A0A8X6G4P7_TRICU|nr:hypothetical protein TNCT_569361 [Trichonephila clavata]